MKVKATPTQKMFLRDIKTGHMTSTRADGLYCPLLVSGWLMFQPVDQLFCSASDMSINCSARLFDSSSLFCLRHLARLFLNHTCTVPQ